MFGVGAEPLYAMGRPLQVIGLLLMIIGLFGSTMLLSGNAGLVALADPCVPGGGEQPVTQVTPTPVPPRPSGAPAKELNSYPVFAPTQTLVTPTPSPTPSPTPRPVATASPADAKLPPCPSHAHRLFGSGPIIFSGNGSLDLGSHRSQSSGQATTQSTAQSQVGVAMSFSVSRRTDESSLAITQALGSFNGVYNAAQINVNYSTPKYLLDYGTISGPADTQLSNGSFNQGITFGVPLGTQEWDLIGAHTIGANGEGFRVGALRHSSTSRNGTLFSQTLYDAFGEQSHGSAVTLDLAVSHFGPSSSTRFEAAASKAHGIPNVPDGLRFAYGSNLNFNGAASSTDLSYVHIPDAYVALGQVQYAQSQLQVTRRNTLFHGILTLNYASLRSIVSGVASRSSHEALNYNLPLGSRINTQWLLNYATTESGGDTSRERDAGLQLSEQFGGANLQESLQSSVVSDAQAGTSAQRQIAFDVSRQLFGGYASGEISELNASGIGASGSIRSVQAEYTRQFGYKTELSFTAASTHSTVTGSGYSATDQFTTTYGVLRRLSPVVALRATYGRTRQSGGFGGSSSYLNFDIVGPLAIGTASRYTGRPNPNLPAVIDGHVFLQTGSTSYGLTGQRGFPNVLVTLDGGQTQRTDAAGSYEFRFVRPGPHIVSIAPGTLPAGVVADSSSQSIEVQGGQIATVDFSAGQFAAVGGRVVQRINGSIQPVPGVLIVVDGTEQGYSGNDGVYQIGHLSAGKHTVKVSTDTLPATLSVLGPSSKAVNVNVGSVTKLDWTLTGLGSISGVVLFTANSGFGDLIGAPNVYVVAHPGEHASITGADGHFIIDNLPPGSYTLTLDEDTLPDGQGIIDAPDGPVDVTGEEAVQGVTFKIGPQAKQVIMSFGGGASAAVSANFRPEKVPPNSIATLIVTTSEAHPKSVTAQADLFGTIPLRYDKAARAWIARIVVSPTVANGDYPVHVDVEGPKSGSTDTTLTVNNSVPLIYARGTPAKPRPGQLIHVVARVVADVRGGEEVVLEDGQHFTLPTPHRGIITFSFHATHPLPYHGLVLTRTGQRIPFVIGP